MKQGTRNTWLAALIALALGAVELVAYQGLAPRAEAMLSGGGNRTALEAGRIVARNLAGFVVASAQAAAGDLVLLGVKQTTHAYRLAQHVLGVADPTAGVCGNPGSQPGAHPESEAVVASEPDMPCAPSAQSVLAPASKSACAPCPACPGRPAKAARSARLGRSGA